MPWKAYHKARLLPYRAAGAEILGGLLLGLGIHASRRVPGFIGDLRALKEHWRDQREQARVDKVAALAQLPLDKFTKEVPFIVSKLEDPNPLMRNAAVQALAQLPADTLAAHAPTIVGKLEDSMSGVREAAGGARATRRAGA